MKGWELYVWRQDDQTVCALMTGTNRLKSADEIRAAGEPGLDPVKRKLKELARGQFVTITGATRRDPPPKEAANDLEAFGIDLGLQIHAAN